MCLVIVASSSLLTNTKGHSNALTGHTRQGLNIKRQEQLIKKLDKKYKFTDADADILNEIINLEYRLTLLDEGHDWQTL